MSTTFETDPSMLELFHIEAENHCKTMSKGILDLKSDPNNIDAVDPMMRAAQSLKGAAKLVNVVPAAELTLALEDLFNDIKKGKRSLSDQDIDIVARSIETLNEISNLQADEISDWYRENKINIDNLKNLIQQCGEKPGENATPVETSTPVQNSKSASDLMPSSKLDAGMLELLRIEVDTHTQTLTDNLLVLDSNPGDQKMLESMMRAAHSIKGAARMVGINSAVALAHIMEDCFVAAQKGNITLSSDSVDIFLNCTDLLKTIGSLAPDEQRGWTESNLQQINNSISRMDLVLAGVPLQIATAAPTIATPPADEKPRVARKPETSEETKESPDKEKTVTQDQSAAGESDRYVRISTERINRLLGLSGELIVASKWVENHTEGLLGIKKWQSELVSMLDRLKSILDEEDISDMAYSILIDSIYKAHNCRLSLSEKLGDLEDFERRTGNLASRLNHEVITSRMRPFRDGIQGLQRMVRDVARSLNKKVVLEIQGIDTQVDRDILEKIKAPLNHILRNAVDHGIESPEERLANGKKETGTIVLEAYHNAGMLTVAIRDDGRGVDLDVLREKIIKRNMVNAAMADTLSESELLDFLFLPSFSTRDEVTEISGRGVGLDVVHTVVQEMRGQIRSSTQKGNGLSIQLQLPITLSVMRTLAIETGDEPYAFPLARIHSIVRLPRKDISTLEDRQYFKHTGINIGLVECRQILGLQSSDSSDEEINVVIIGDRSNLYGIVVDRILGERDMAIHALDPRIGKVKNVSSAAINEDGSPTLIFDIDDMILSIHDLVSDDRISKLSNSGASQSRTNVKHVLVVDDSLTVREVERKLLESRGYVVDVAVDGMDGWNTLREGQYDLVISDVDMPRMNGIEFVSMIKRDANYKSMPVMIVSYKDNPEDRQRGLEAGADYYLAKGSFHDESLIDAVIDLIGEANS